MIDITILHWRISPYFICFLLSFVLAYLYATWYLKKAGVRGSHIFYSELLNTVLALYFGAFYTFIVQLAEQGKVETFGFSSLGGMAGILLGVWIFTKISKEHKIDCICAGIGTDVCGFKARLLFCRLLCWHEISGTWQYPLS